MPLAPEWREWIAENLLRGSDPAFVAGVLAEQGLADAEAAVDEIAKDPVLRAARKLLVRGAGAEQAARLRRTFDAQIPFEVDDLSEADFQRTYWTGHHPVVYRGGASTWPALSWELPTLAKAYGHHEVGVLRGRAANPHWWRQREQVESKLPFGELISAMQSSEGDDLYAVGRSQLLQHPGLVPLQADVGTMPGIHPEKPAALLWVGPSGTRTPLHHDQSSAWLVQVHGTKKVWLASPLEPSLLTTAEGVFNHADPREPPATEQAEVRWLHAELHPGDAVFFPVGWWHQVVATSASISISLGGFSLPHVHSWYSPGRPIARS